MYMNYFFNVDDLPSVKEGLPESRNNPRNDFPLSLSWSKGPAEVYGPQGRHSFPDGASCEVRGSLMREDGPQEFRMVLDEGLDIPSAEKLRELMKEGEKGQDIRFTWHVFPQYGGGYDYTWSSCYVSLDLVFSDGSRLSERNTTTRDGQPAGALALGRSRTLIPREWNKLVFTLNPIIESLPADVSISAIELTAAVEGRDDLRAGVLSPLGEEVPEASREALEKEAREDLETASIHAFLGPISIQAYASEERNDLADYVNILRGTNDSRSFSRGLAVPAVAVPQGFNFFCPATERADKNDYDKVYDYMSHKFTGITISHEPSVWVGDRATFQFMAASEALETINEDGRAAEFSHEDEFAKPYAYELSGMSGPASAVDIGITPTMHAAILRFRFREEAVQNLVILDSIRDKGKGTLVLDHERQDRFTAVLRDVSNGMQPMYVVGLFDTRWEEALMTAPMQAGLKYGEGDREITLRIGTSFIDEATAWEALADEVGRESYESAKEKAKALWNEQLEVLRVPADLPAAQLETIYSNLYRLYLYPNALHETKRPQYRSPYANSEGDHEVRRGKMFYNNGFWDTYRTAWPAYALFTPKLAEELADGIIEHWRASEWIPRWVAPGGTDSMVGTSADIIMADFASRGILDAKLRMEAWESTLPDGNQASHNTVNGGRKDAFKAFFDGFMSVETHEGLSWTLEGCLNDYGLSLLASDQGEKDYAAYFAHRARSHQRMFWTDEDGRGWYRGKNRDGSLPEDKPFDPIAWGGDYTETDAWNMAFTAVHDGQELLRLHGGKEKMAERLDELMTMPGTFEVGGYGGVIHEMVEAREIKVGRLGVSNQPSHHLPSMYQIAGRPDRASLILRDVAKRGQIGSDFGQGFIGDEDNGEMSAFYLFAALGLYPLIPGLPIFSLTAPLLPAADIRMDDGKVLKIRTDGDVQNDEYIRNVLWNGEPIHVSYITHHRIAEGGTLTFLLSPTPTDWGRSTRYPSLDDLIGEQGTWTDALDSDYMFRLEGISPRNTDSGVPGSETSASELMSGLTDNDSRTQAVFALDDPKSEGAVIFEFPEEQKVRALTLTSSDNWKDVPGRVTLQCSDEPNGPWETLLDRPVKFTKPYQTVPFVAEDPQSARWYRLALHAPQVGLLPRLLTRSDAGEKILRLAELELLTELDQDTIDRVDR